MQSSSYYTACTENVLITHGVFYAHQDVALSSKLFVSAQGEAVKTIMGGAYHQVKVILGVMQIRL